MILHNVQVVNFGAWYPRYSVLDPHHPWPAWQTDMKELINERLANYKATTFWRSYAAAHYGGTNGTNTFEKVSLVTSQLHITDAAVKARKRGTGSSDKFVSLNHILHGCLAG